MAGLIREVEPRAGSQKLSSPATQASAPASVSPQSSDPVLGASHGGSATGRFLVAPGAQLPDSPLPVSPTFPTFPISPPATSHVEPHATTAPARMNEPYRRISMADPQPRAGTYEEKTAFQAYQLASARAVRLAGTPTESIDSLLIKPTPKDAGEMLVEVASASGSGDVYRDKRPQPRPLQQPLEALLAPGGNAPSMLTPAVRPDRGASFPVAWIRVQPLSFTRTRHLRNPWNADREVKVSRDGTELEPNVGGRLLTQWDELPTTSPPIQRKKGGNRRRTRVIRRQSTLPLSLGAHPATVR